MKLHVVERYHSTAMRRMAEPLVQLLGATTSADIDYEAMNIHVPWHFITGETKGHHAIVYTHCNPGDKRRLEDACARAEMVFCMSFQGRREILELGVPIEKTWVAYPGSGEFLARRKNVGLVGYVQPNGRKREHVLTDLAYLLDEDTKSMLNFIASGANWQGAINEAKAAGLHAMLATEKTGHADDPDMNALYQAMDLLLVSGFVEGGPLPFLEAYKAGVPVVASDVGLAADFLDAKDKYRTAEDLAVWLTKWVEPTLQRMFLGHLFTWTAYAEEFAIALMPLTGETFLEHAGVPRYRQLLDLIDERKPQSICEIGTWNGQRALQMIQTAQRHQEEVHYQGFDVFEKSTPGLVRREFSKDGYPMNSVEQRLRASGAFLWLHPGDTNKTLKDESVHADFYFIDGGHSYDTIANDWGWVAQDMEKESVVVFDDYCTEGKPGYGCKPIVDNLGDGYKVEILPVITEGMNGRVQMAKVTRA